MTVHRLISSDEINAAIEAENSEAYISGLIELLDNPDIVGIAPILIVADEEDEDFILITPTWKYSVRELIGILEQVKKTL